MFEIFRNLTSLQLILIGVTILFVLMKTKEHFDITESGLTNDIKKKIKNKVFGIRGSSKFKNFLFRTNKDECGLLGKNDCNTDYCQYTDKCIIKSDDDVLKKLNDKLNNNPEFKLSGY